MVMPFPRVFWLLSTKNTASSYKLGNITLPTVSTSTGQLISAMVLLTFQKMQVQLFQTKKNRHHRSNTITLKHSDDLQKWKCFFPNAQPNFLFCRQPHQPTMRKESQISTWPLLDLKNQATITLFCYFLRMLLSDSVLFLLSAIICCLLASEQIRFVWNMYQQLINSAYHLCWISIT